MHAKTTTTTVVLNAGYEPIQLISWQRAVCLVFSEKAEVISEYAGRLVRSAQRTFPLPRVVRLKTYVHGLKKLNLRSKYNRRNLFTRDRYCCQYCGKKCSPKQVTVDHVHPKSKGGPDSFQNTVTACQPCNSRKGSRTPDEAGMRLLRRPVTPELTDLLDDLHHNFHPRPAGADPASLVPGDYGGRGDGQGDE